MIYARLDEAIEDLDSRLGGLPRPAEAEDIGSSAFVQVTGLRPKAEITDSSTPSRIPLPDTQEDPCPAFPQARDPFSTWWQVKDSNLRSSRDASTDLRRQACDQQYCPSSRNFRAYAPQIADDHRPPPDTSSQSVFTVW